jgi:cytoskeletal protein CcmA (bactofilin family)
MALWKDTAPAATPTPPPRDTLARDAFRDTPKDAEKATAVPFTQTRSKAEPKESVIAADLTIEGKIEGSGHVRIAGRFKGDVNVTGNLTIESGAHLTGQVKAQTVVVAGELHGNIDGATRVELQETGVLAGDVKAASFTVSAGSRMRGQVEFGWEEKTTRAAAAN